MTRGQAPRTSRRAIARTLVLAALAMLSLSFAWHPAYAWDSRTHMLIAGLAVSALPPSPLTHTLTVNESPLEHDAIAPDFELKRLYGHAEEIRHYIDLENFGPHPFTELNPDLSAMRRRYSDRKLDRAGTLPWTIEETAGTLEQAWRAGDCAQVVRQAGYLAHYVGDASQPLHSTRYYDGYAGDAGVHRRLEGAVDNSAREIEEDAHPLVHVTKIGSVWTTALTEIHDANAFVPEVIRTDRAARTDFPDDREGYARVLMRIDGPMLAGQIAAASSALASIWLYEWTQAGSPAICTGVYSSLESGAAGFLKPLTLR